MGDYFFDFFDAFATDVYGSYFDSGYYYSPFGYSYLRAYPVVFGSGGSVFGTSVGSAGAASREEGRVINGLGYTRVMTTRDAEAVAASDGSSSTRGASGRTVTTEGYTGGDTRSTSSGASSSGGSGGSSSSGDSGRTAVPR
jgi:hypothetical protein